MTQGTATRTRIALLIYLITQGVLFGAGLVLVLTRPALTEESGFWISAVIVASFVLAAPIAWWIAPRMRARVSRQNIVPTPAP